MTKGTIFNIKRFSVHDGPGIRTSIFLMGCPLDCIWCHNPEGIASSVSVWYNRNICILCGSCVDICPEKALSLSSENNQVKIDRELCMIHGSCVDICPTGAISFTGSSITLGEIMEEIRKDRLFFENSGGGVTLTGGEPLFQPDFCTELLKVCRNEGINTALETSLYCDKTVLENILGFADLFIVDIKIFETKSHEKYTGKSNRLIKENLQFLAGTGKPLLVRIPMIKGITDLSANIESIKGFLMELGGDIPVEYLDYNPLSAAKYQRLSIPYPLDDIYKLNP